MKKLVRAMSDVVPRLDHEVVVKRMQHLETLYRNALSREITLREVSVSVAIAARKSVRLYSSESKEETKENEERILLQSVTDLCT